MLSTEIADQLKDVRTAASQLVAQLGADATGTAPLLHAVTALEQRLARGADSGTLAPTAARLQQAEAQIAQLEQVLTDIPMGICMFHGREQRFIFSNPSYDQLVGRTDMVGKTVREVFPELVGQGIYELLDAVYTMGEPFTASEMLVQLDRDGDGAVEDIYYDFTYRALRDQRGTPTGVVDYVLDTSDRRALEQERAQVLQLTQAARHTAEVERQRLLTVLRQAPAAICTLEGPDHVYTFINTAYEQLAGHGNVVGQMVRVALPELAGQGFFELLDNVYASGVPFIGNEMPLQLDRYGLGVTEHTFVNFVYAPLRDINDRISGVFVQAVEVTELVAARQQAEAAVVVRDQFMSIAAHELKTPLTTILGYIEVLKRRMRHAGAVDERTDRMLIMIGAQGQRLNRLIDTLMDVARINQGQLTLECAPLDLAALTARVVDEVSVMGNHRVIQVTIPAEPCMVWGDGLRLEQVLINLIQNAIKYSGAGSTVAVTASCDGAQVWVHIQDTGMGIPLEALPHLFERFYRVSMAANRHIPGMGIGLSVVKDIVTLHGGTVSVESTEGIGSTFTIWLPQIDLDRLCGTDGYGAG